MRSKRLSNLFILTRRQAKTTYLPFDLRSHRYYMSATYLLHTASSRGFAVTDRPKPPAFSAEALDTATRAKRARQARHDQAVGPRIHELRAQGLSWNRVAQALEGEGVLSPQGRPNWRPIQVQRIAARTVATSTAPPGRLNRFLTWLRSFARLSMTPAA